MTTETSKGQLYKETLSVPSRKAMKKMKVENQKECKRSKFCSVAGRRGFNK